MFQHVDTYAGDPILSLMEEFQHDPRPHKVNLSIGLYYNEAQQVPQLRAIQQAYQDLNAEQQKVKLYLPMQGMPAYNSAVQALIFGEDSPACQAGRVVTLQTLGGSGALKVAADFLKRYFPASELWVSRPTWDNHIAIFQGASIRCHEYPYFDPHSGQMDFAAMLDCLQQLPAQSIVLLHPCCHNPTGADLLPVQWDQLIELLAQKQLIPLLDMAYQGFAEDFHADAYAIRAMDRAGLNFLVSHSFSKIFSLYGERVGSLSAVCDDATTAQSVLGQLKATVRRIYSSPPTTGAMLIQHVLHTPTLYQNWQDELTEMRERIQQMRERLKQQLELALPGQSFDYLTRQRGMFSYTGLSAAQADQLKQEFGIYLVRSGRMCVAGLNQNNVDAVAHAMAQVLQHSDTALTA